VYQPRARTGQHGDGDDHYGGRIAVSDTILDTGETTTPEDPAVEEVAAGMLPDDDEEFASPPPPAAERAAEPS
jgi:hypothetical protein